MGEVVQVAQAKGLNVPEGTIDKLIEQCTSVKEGLPSSMLFDYLAGRPMEVEVSRNGVLVAVSLFAGSEAYCFGGPPCTVP